MSDTADRAGPMLYLVVGLPAAGKTTVAKQIAADRPALRLTPDDWMIPLYGEPDARSKRAVLEGRLIWVAFEALRLGVSVVLDFGFWSIDERSALRWLAARHGAAARVVYLPVDRGTQLQRIHQRWTTTPEQTYPDMELDVDRWRDMFEAPGEAELGDLAIDSPPDRWDTWAEWARDRWPFVTVEPPPSRTA